MRLLWPAICFGLLSVPLRTDTWANLHLLPNGKWNQRRLYAMWCYSTQWGQVSFSLKCFSDIFVGRTIKMTQVSPTSEAPVSANKGRNDRNSMLCEAVQRRWFCIRCASYKGTKHQALTRSTCNFNCIYHPFSVCFPLKLERYFEHWSLWCFWPQKEQKKQKTKPQLCHLHLADENFSKTHAHIAASPCDETNPTCFCFEAGLWDVRLDMGF